MHIELAYGKTGLNLELPERPGITVIEPAYQPGLTDEEAALRAALRQPTGSPALADLVMPDDRVAIVVCDGTRPMPSARVLPVLLNELGDIDPDQVQIINATGTHRANTPAELAAFLGADVINRYPVVNHNAFDLASHDYLGETPRGGPIWIDQAYTRADVRILTGFIEPHFFAGFSGGPKMIAPGCAAIQTVLHLHSAPLIADPQATWGEIEQNPIQREIRAIAQRVGSTFSLNVTINKDHAITGVYAGEVFASHALGCAAVRQTAMQPVDEPFDIVITTNSGFPLDQNLYQAVKGMSAAALIVRPGGHIICAAACADGLPEHGNYKDILRAGASPQALLDTIQSPGYARHDQWQAQIQAQIQLKATVYLKNETLSDAQVRQAHLRPIHSIEDTVAEIEHTLGRPATICVLPQGPQTIPILRHS